LLGYGSRPGDVLADKDALATARGFFGMKDRHTSPRKLGLV
jgi:hypothetical protein